MRCERYKSYGTPFRSDGIGKSHNNDDIPRSSSASYLFTCYEADENEDGPPPPYPQIIAGLGKIHTHTYVHIYSRT